MPRLRRYNHDTDQYDRQCTQCLVWMPETTDNYSYNNNRRRFNSWCKPCVRAYRRNTTTGVGRRFGVEIEFIGSSYRLELAMREQGLQCSMQEYNHRVSRNTWKIVPDGSVSGGAELVSPILQGTRGFEQLAKASAALNAAGVTINRSTGLHVHHDVRDLRVSAFKTFVRNWSNCQDAIDMMVAPSRRLDRNMYCRRLTGRDLASVDLLETMDLHLAARTLSGDRYRTLNLQSYGRYGTVEVRQHQGSIDGAQISAWVRFGQAMIQAGVDDIALAYSDADTLIDTLSLSDDTKTYLHDRVRKLARVTAR
jgi:hypothetical protein